MSLEGGARNGEFWKWVVDHEVRARAIRRRHGSGARDGSTGMEELWRSESAPSVLAPVVDHGLIFPSLHDIHRQKERKASGVKLPPVPGSPSQSQLSWPGKAQLGADVESAVTMATTAAAAAYALSNVTTGRPMGSTISLGAPVEGSGIGAAAPASRLTAPAPVSAAAAAAEATAEAIRAAKEAQRRRKQERKLA
mmetsp:Transcript_273/g.619  ORF Transcript_273/g.619 Transcript_273/m.619 type:complete len:195 (-) Transcript_273:103-687(-)